VDEYRNKEYPAAKNLASIKRGMAQEEYAVIDVISIISPRRLREGGAPILHAVKRNHHMVIIGNKVIKPLVVIILRV